MYIPVYLLSFLTAVTADSHSLVLFATYIVKQTQFPDFTVVVMMDDVQLAYYDSNTRRIIYRSHTDAEDSDEEQRDAIVIFSDIYKSMKARAFYLKEHTNQTDGFHVHQKLVECELLDSDKPGKIHSLDAFNVQNVEDFTFDRELNSIQSKLKWVIEWDEVGWRHLHFLYKNIYQSVCIKVLRRHLQMKNNSVTKKVKPTVKLFKKTLMDSYGRTRITCLATGFYPRHINLTILSNGQPADKQIIGHLLPSGDETYQIRTSLEISADELHGKHDYSCITNHISLNNTLHTMFDQEESAVRSFTQFVIISVVVCVVVLTILIITAFILRSQRISEGFTTSVHWHYSCTPTLEKDATVHEE